MSDAEPLLCPEVLGLVEGDQQGRVAQGGRGGVGRSHSAFGRQNAGIGGKKKEICEKTWQGFMNPDCENSAGIKS